MSISIRSAINDLLVLQLALKNRIAEVKAVESKLGQRVAELEAKECMREKYVSELALELQRNPGVPIPLPGNRSFKNTYTVRSNVKAVSRTNYDTTNASEKTGVDINVIQGQKEGGSLVMAETPDEPGETAIHESTMRVRKIPTSNRYISRWSRVTYPIIDKVFTNNYETDATITQMVLPKEEIIKQALLNCDKEDNQQNREELLSELKNANRRFKQRFRQRRRKGIQGKNNGI